MWKIREITDKVTNVVMNYSEVEAKVREATNDDAWGPHGQAMNEIAQFTFTYEHFPEVLGMLWKRLLHENKKNWRRVYKSLLLLHYLVRNGSERVVTSAREHIYDLRGLEAYTFTDEFGKDQGINVRQKAKDLVDLIQDDDRLREDRKKAKKNKDKYIGMSGMDTKLGGYTDRYDDEAPKKSVNRAGSLQEIDDWDRGSKKSVAEEAMGKVKELWNRTRGFDEPPDYGNEDDLFDDEGPPNRFTEFRDQEESDEITMERTSTTTTEKITAGRKRASKKVDLGAASSLGKDSTDAHSQSSKTSADLFSASKAPTDLMGDFADFQANDSSNAVVVASENFADFDNMGANQNGDFGDFKSSSQNGSDFGDFASVSNATSAPSAGSSNAALLASLMSTPMPQTTPQMPQMGANMPQMGQMNGMGMMNQPNMMTSPPNMMSQSNMMAQPNMMMSSPNMMTSPPNMMTSQPNMMTSQPNMMTSQPNMMTSPPNMMGNMGMQQQPGMMTSQPQSGMMGNPSMGGMMGNPSMMGNQSMMGNPSMMGAGSGMMQPQGKTWQQKGTVDINLDDLSAASRFKKQQNPSMNSLQHNGAPVATGLYPQNQLSGLSQGSMAGFSQGSMAGFSQGSMAGFSQGSMAGLSSGMGQMNMGSPSQPMQGGMPQTQQQQQQQQQQIQQHQFDFGNFS